jgi:preprotein translocase subunit SecA
MLKSIVNRVFGTRHERERRRVQPIVDAINEQYERLQGVSDEELRGQTAKFREIIRERTGEIETRIAELKAAKRSASDAASASASTWSSGARRARAVEAELRAALAEVSDEILPEAFATCARARGASSARRPR